MLSSLRHLQKAKTDLRSVLGAFNKRHMDNFASGNSSMYIEQMYSQWKENPSSVHASWNAYFSNIDAGSSVPFQMPPTLGTSPMVVSASGNTKEDIEKSSKLLLLLRAYQTKGHEMANLDPLGLEKEFVQHGKREGRVISPELDYKYYGFTEADLDKEFYIYGHKIEGFLETKNVWTIRELLEKYKSAYCQHIGLEHMHIMNKDECNWIRHKMELHGTDPLSKEQNLKFLENLLKCSLFEEFLTKKYSTSKRFSISGADGFVPTLKFIVDRAVENGVEKVIIGMPHRGRINVLANICMKPLEDILADFQGVQPEISATSWGSAGDVKYHLGTTTEQEYPNGKKVSVSLMPNPSHLECIDPVVVGRVRAHQHYMHDNDRSKVMGILIHGDAAFAGQGIVYETMEMEDLKRYCVGGTIHVVVNNQIGFTTTPADSRTGVYATDIAKSIGAPIFHVNGEDPKALVRVAEIAADYRTKYHKDVIVDVYGYRLYGHNELDQPMFTQPIMYKAVHKMKPLHTKIKESMVASGKVSQEELNEIVTKISKSLDDAFEKSKTMKIDYKEWVAKSLKELKPPEHAHAFEDSGYGKDKLIELGKTLCTIPADFKPHPQIKKVYAQRLKTIEEGKGLDWATGEALAWGTLLKEGYHVRISGQDVQRGTFSHRHAVLHDQEKDERWSPFQSLEKDDATFEACNSHLSECGVLGFEYGYAMANPNTLCMWEAQFGDFANGAQVQIDNMISSGETKWGLQNGIVMLLPHGYDGQGAEHSSARLERYLQLSDDDPNVCVPEKFLETHTNWRVCVCTTPANYFHLLRSQVRKTFRKPLVHMSPKRLLRLRDASSNLNDFAQGTKFKRIYPELEPEKLVVPEKVRKLILCSGQVYYDILKARQDAGIEDIAIIRVEQIAPLSHQEIEEQVKLYSNANVLWVQEEHMNMGAWSFVQPRLNVLLSALGKRNIEYVGRRPSAAPAAGFFSAHERELRTLLADAMA